MKKMGFKILSVLLLTKCIFIYCDKRSLVMMTMSITFGRKLLDPCQKQLKLGADVINDFRQFWDIKHQLTKKEVGCAVICVANALHLLDSKGLFYVPHAEGFIRASGADDNMVRQLVTLVEVCKNFTSMNQDPCNIALDVANCFRKGVQEKKWTPDIPTSKTRRISQRRCSN